MAYPPERIPGDVTDKKTVVVNIRNGRCDVYIGRGTPFGNPFVLGVDGDRQEVIRKYEVYFEERLRVELGFKEKVLALRGKTLGCHCAPMSCHGEAIVRFLDREGKP